MNEALAVVRFKALSDPARLRIVRILAEPPDDQMLSDLRCSLAYGVCFCHLEERLGLAKPTISHHLKVLREAGLIEVVRVGKWSHYRLLPAGLEGLIQDLGELRKKQKLIQFERAL
ncbi:ArsR/SmtB family transcription factor [Meiothermus rufus]|uniref:ArsR/SmtB family transcription factor n=1 Tax=Meiothermus rufus TaxID=604332 RepID=UPI000481ED1D|nr:metalloregulator ArsR/SmtB family transcription factor [Meiothermus rufus]